MSDDTSVTRALAPVVDGEVVSVERLSGGASRETWSVDVVRGDERVGLVLQRRRAGASDLAGDVGLEARLLRAAALAGVPVPELVASGADDGFGGPWTLCRRLDGEAMPRVVLHAAELEGARHALTAQCGQALAAVHAIDVDVVGGDGADPVPEDPIGGLRAVLDGVSGRRPALELALRRLELEPPPVREPAVVHGDFRLGNLLVDGSGLAAVLDWELAHVGNPVEDLGWFCVRAWRFGSSLRAGGVGTAGELLAAYRDAGGIEVSGAELAWWELYGTVRWGVICAVQAEAHLSGAVRSVELAAIGRRACETEYDALRLLGVAVPTVPSSATSPEGTSPVGVDAVHDRPSAVELLDAVAGFLEDDVRGATEGRVRYHAAVAARVLAMVRREVGAGAGPGERLASGLAALGVANVDQLASWIRSGRLDERWEHVAEVVASATADRLAVANPRYAADADTDRS